MTKKVSEVDKEVQELRKKVAELEARPVPPKRDPEPPWYLSFWAWFCIGLVIAMGYLIYVFLKSEHFIIPKFHLSAMILIPFTKDMCQAVLDGHKTCTSRRRLFGSEGDWFSINKRTFVITNVSSCPLGYIAKNMHKQEGFSDPEGFINKWNQIHHLRRYDPYQTVWLHEFKEVKWTS